MAINECTSEDSSAVLTSPSRMLKLNWLFILVVLFRLIHGKEVANSEVIYAYPPPDKYEGLYGKGNDLRDMETNSNEIPDTNEIPNIPNNFTNEEYSFTLFNWNLRSGVPISENNTIEELQSVFDSSLDTKIVVHGWLSSAHSYIVNNTIKVYLSSRNLNAIAVDWSTLAGYKIYPVTTYSVAPVGRGVAALVKRLLEAKVTTLKKLHLIGHSLGAHVMGVAGHNIKKAAGKSVSRITGLDPASPLFEYIGGETSRLDPGDGEFVDVIHTAGGAAGYYGVLGHADFYPNGGTPFQPGCKELSLNAVGCSHGMSYVYYDESITNPKGFKSVQCDSWDAFYSKSCKDSNYTYMGDPCPSSARGVFYLSTNAKPPYGRG